jgi:hypothetical protein
MTDPSPAIGAASARACLAAATVATVGMVAVVGPLTLSGGFNWAAMLLMACNTFMFALVIAAMHLVIALPLYLALRQVGPVPTGVAAACGFAIGAAPAMLLFGWSADGGASFYGIAFMVVGVPGLAAGFVFGRNLNKAA